MTLREMIQALGRIAAEHGDDLPVLAFDNREGGTVAEAHYIPRDPSEWGEPAHVWIVGNHEDPWEESND